MLELENFLLGSWNASSATEPASSALFVGFDKVLDVVEVEGHVLGDLLWMPSGNHASINVLKNIIRLSKWWKIVPETRVASDVDVLLHLEVDHGDVK